MSALRPKADMRELLRDRLHKNSIFCTKSSPLVELYVQSPPVDRERSLCSVFLAYAEDYRVDVKFVCDRIGTILFDHLVGAGKQRGWDGETDRLGSLEVDHELELGRLQHRKVAGLLPLQDAADGEAGRP